MAEIRQQETADVVIVGAGPSGLATAISLMKLRCFSKIVVLERLPRDFEPDWIKSSTLGLNNRGMRWFKEFGLVDDVKKISAYFEAKEIRLCDLEGNIKITNLPPKQDGYYRQYVKRYVLFDYMRDEMFRIASKEGCQLELRNESPVTTVAKSTAEGFYVVVEPKEGANYEISAPLVVGASGGRTPVHQAFRDHCCGFKIFEVPYMHVGRRRKTIHMTVPTDLLPCGKFGIFSGRDKGSLICFPQRGDSKRLLTCSFPRGIDFKDGTEVLNYLEDNYPILDFRGGCDEGYLEAFAKHHGLVYPHIYYANRIALTAGNGGACLVGDAAHIGTPCLANGVNSAFVGVLTLYNVFKAGLKEGKTVAQMLCDFEKIHLEDSKAVVQLLPIGHPYQYPNMPMTWKRRWFNFNQGLRKKYSKKFPAIIKPPVLDQIQDIDLSIGQILRNYNRTSFNMICIVTAGVGVAVAGLVKLVGLGSKLMHRSRSS